MDGGPKWITIFLLLLNIFLYGEGVFVYPEVFNDTERDSFVVGEFPKSFMWGVASSAYQVEGAWNEGGKGESIWDTFTHKWMQENSDVGCNAYHNIDRDIRLIKKMGLTHYKFSMSWSRLIPSGKIVDSINIPGVNYYNYLIDGLIEANITPIVTLYHWDLPQALEDDGGWLNNQTISDFLDFAVVCFQNYADRVPYWITFDNPYKFCVHGYGNGSLAPGTGDPGTGPYVCANNVIRAHALVYRMYYNNNFRTSVNGSIGISLDCDWYEPRDSLNSFDLAAAEKARKFRTGWFAHPIFMDGDYPRTMKINIKERSLQQGYNISRLPEFTEDQKETIAKTSDFLGMSHYTTKLVSSPTSSGDVTVPSWATDVNFQESVNASWPTSAHPSDRVVPWGIRKALTWIKSEYNDPTVLITGNGIATSGQAEDADRVKYIKAYTNEILKAINEDGVNVIGYTTTLMDSFEWDLGFSLKYGLHSVDFNDIHRRRTPRLSSTYYAQLAEENGFTTNKAPSQAISETLILGLFVIISYLCINL
ncbi:myrosinase 1-like [Antedon mediterranea]|uniref:myrosinase 1-like n=1 Tax=Antedon mediterranea TaxID=105859 RepID=UPI003AF55638